MNKLIKLTTTIIILLLLNNTPLFAQQIFVNGIREFSIDVNTIIKVDGKIIPPSTKDIFGTGGFKIKFSLNPADANQTISQGTFADINLISDIKGPVTSINPLTILDQAVFTTADTVLENVLSIDELIVSDLVSVSGTINETDNSIQLSRLEKETTLAEWKLRGFARNITATSFTIGNLSINLNGVVADNCPNGFVNNTFVEIIANEDVNYTTGNALSTLTTIECQTPDVDEGSVGVIPIVVEGIISEIIDLSSFRINNLLIFFDASTSFDNGEAEHIDLGTKVEVQGFIDTDTQFVSATTIRFINHRIKIIAPVNPSDITIGQSISIFGKTINITPQTRDEDNIIASGLITQRQVEVRGFSDSQGNIFAQRVRDRGTADANDTKLRGDVTDINQPFFAINGISIDASNSTFELADGIVDIDTFFATLLIGMQATIENASYDSQSNTLSLGEIELVEQETEDDPDDTNRSTKTAYYRDIFGTGGIGIATITGTEIIFNSGFE